MAPVKNEGKGGVSEVGVSVTSDMKRLRKTFTYLLICVSSSVDVV